MKKRSWLLIILMGIIIGQLSGCAKVAKPIIKEVPINQSTNNCLKEWQLTTTSETKLFKINVPKDWEQPLTLVSVTDNETNGLVYNHIWDFPKKDNINFYQLNNYRLYLLVETVDGQSRFLFFDDQLKNIYMEKRVTNTKKNTLLAITYSNQPTVGNKIVRDDHSVIYSK